MRKKNYSTLIELQPVASFSFHYNLFNTNEPIRGDTSQCSCIESLVQMASHSLYSFTIDGESLDLKLKYAHIVVHTLLDAASTVRP